MDEYDILRAAQTTYLKMKVNDAMKDGWKPQGGVSSVEGIDRATWYAQAMVRTRGND